MWQTIAVHACDQPDIVLPIWLMRFSDTDHTRLGRTSRFPPPFYADNSALYYLRHYSIRSTSTMAFVIVDQDEFDKDHGRLSPTTRRLPLQVLPWPAVSLGLKWSWGSGRSGARGGDSGKPVRKDQPLSWQFCPLAKRRSRSWSTVIPWMDDSSMACNTKWEI
jgi:hypothetical protein